MLCPRPGFKSEVEVDEPLDLSEYTIEDVVEDGDIYGVIKIRFKLRNGYFSLNFDKMLTLMEYFGVRKSADMKGKTFTSVISGNSTKAMEQLAHEIDMGGGRSQTAVEDVPRSIHAEDGSEEAAAAQSMHRYFPYYERPSE